MDILITFLVGLVVRAMGLVRGGGWIGSILDAMRLLFAYPLMSKKA